MTALLVAWKDLKLLARDWAALAFTLIVPVMVVTIVATSLGGDAGPTITVPVVNEDEGPVAAILMDVLAEHVIVVETSREDARRRVLEAQSSATALVLPEKLSKRYLAGIPSTLTLWVDPAKGNEVQTVQVPPGSVLATYSDGVTEANDPDEEEYGMERFGETLRAHRTEGAHGIIKDVFDDVEDFAKGVPPVDDLTLMIVKRGEG